MTSHIRIEHHGAVGALTIFKQILESIQRFGAE